MTASSCTATATVRWCPTAAFDVPRDDRNPCTEAVCDLDVARQEPKVAGTPCGKEGVCNGTGRCGLCIPESTRCEGTAVSTCDEAGQWTPPAACGLERPRCRERDGAARCIGVQELATGAGHVCARFEDGSVTCWGAGGAGQLGRGVPVGPAWVNGYRAHAVGPRHACGIRPDGGVFCWGAGEFGQLGQGRFDSSASHVATGVSAGAIAVGRDHSCAAKTDGTVLCWGRNDRGQLGYGKPAGPSPGPVTMMPPLAPGAPRPQPLPAIADADRLLLGYRHTCVHRRSGQVACWGLVPFAELPMLQRDAEPAASGEAPTEEQKARLAARQTMATAKPQPVAGLTAASRLACGDDHCCTLRQDGSVACWGGGKRGELGDGNADRAQAVAVTGVAHVTRLGVGHHHACVLHGDGTVSCWGDNQRGQLGSTGPGGAPRKLAALGPVRDLAVGGDFTCAWLNSGEIQCWGDGALGQLGRANRSPEPGAVRW